jgi:hypothetical protein
MDPKQSGDTNALDVNLSEKDLLTLLAKPLRESKNYWENDFGLKKAREANMNLWLPKHWAGTDVYDYQEDNTYEDPRIFVSTESINSNVNARVPQLEVMPAQDSPMSIELAKDMQKAGQGYVETYDVLDLFRLMSRNLQIKRAGFLKLRWDPNKGQFGEIVTEFVQPEKVVVDKDAQMGEVPRFFAQLIDGHTVEELIDMMPDARNKLLEAVGATRQDKQGNVVAYKTQLGKKLNIYEIWFRYTENGTRQMGVCWVDEKLSRVFDQIKNPNWIYKARKGVIGNLLDEPMPPFIPINYLNDGSSYYDQTTLIEQAAALQKILDRRGFQIMENADQAGGGLVFNTNMISKADMIKLVGSPDERIGVKGDVNRAVARVAPPPLPNYVIEDKVDARNELDNVFGTHNVTRGEKSNNPTLGQDNLQQQGDLTRMDEVSRAVERMAKHYYRYLFQMMKVYYTEKHYFVLNGDDGQYDYVAMHSDNIEDGVDIRVTEGSMRPQDRRGQTNWVGNLVKVGMIDPLTVFEVASGGYMPSAQKMMERFTLWKLDPMAYLSKAKDDEFSREALEDIKILNDGKVPKMRDEYSPSYLKFINNYMISGEFDQLGRAIKASYVQFLRVVQTVMARQMAKLMTQMPTAQEVDAQNQKTAQQAQLEGQIQGAMPQPSAQPGPGAGSGPAGPGPTPPSGPPAAPTPGPAAGPTAGPPGLAQQMAARRPAPGPM